MYALNCGLGNDYAFPDTCTTYVGVAATPVTYPNTNMTATNFPSCTSIFIECCAAVNSMSSGTLSSGDEAGTLLGTASGMICGQTSYIVGCTTTFFEGSLAQRLTSTTGQNGNGATENAVGCNLDAGQYTVMTLG